MAVAKKEYNKTSVDIKCTGGCGIVKKANSANFYKSYSILFSSNYENRMTICKSCVLNIYNGYKKDFDSDKRAVYETCRLLDVYFENALYDAVLEQAKSKESNVMTIYMQKINSLPQYKDKTFIDSDAYDMSAELEKISEDVGRDIVGFWGEGYSQNDYEFLENEYKTLFKRFECDSYSQEMLFQEIAFQRLDIKKKRMNGSSVDKELKTLQDLLGSANIKPAQENASMASDQVTFGTLIKKYENEKPIPEPLGEWNDADWIRKYVLVWFLGHFCKMMGVQNNYSDLYDEEVAKYTVEVDGDE